MTRGKPKAKTAETRRCLVHGSGQSRHGMVRFARSPDGVVVPDILERLPGRGVWVCADHASICLAIEKNAFARGFKNQVDVPDQLIDQLENNLRDRVIGLISMARKAGQVVSGADRVSQTLLERNVPLLLQASDGSDREKRNLGYRDLAKNYSDVLTRKELGAAFGRENIVHAAMTGTSLANRVYAEANRLLGLRIKNIGKNTGNDNGEINNP